MIETQTATRVTKANMTCAFWMSPSRLVGAVPRDAKKLGLPTSPDICKTLQNLAMQIKGVPVFKEFGHFKPYNKEPINKHGLYVVKLRKLSQSATDPLTYATVNFCNSGRQAINYKSCSTRSHRLFEPAITEKSLKSRGLHPSTKTRNQTST